MRPRCADRLQLQKYHEQRPLCIAGALQRVSFGAFLFGTENGNGLFAFRRRQAADESRTGSVPVEGEIDRNLPQEELGDVLLHFKYLVHKDRYTVEKNLERAQLYMPFIYETLRSRGLPRELAYVAFIESGYNPMATSSSRGRGNVAIHFEHGQALRHGAGLVDG